MRRLRLPKRAALPLLAIVAIGGALMLSQSNHRHPGAPTRGDLPPQPPAVSDASAVDVEIRDYDFFPRDLTVRAGTAVTWTNRDVVPHDATEEGDGWSTGMLRQGDSGTAVIDSAGTYGYRCTIHPTMKATLTVVG